MGSDRFINIPVDAFRTSSNIGLPLRNSDNDSTQALHLIFDWIVCHAHAYYTKYKDTKIPQSYLSAYTFTYKCDNKIFDYHLFITKQDASEHENATKQKKLVI